MRQKRPITRGLVDKNCDAEPEASSVAGEPCTPVRKKQPITCGLVDSGESDCRDVLIQNVDVPCSDSDEDSEWDEFILRQC